VSEYVHAAILVTGLEAVDEVVTEARKQALSLQLNPTELVHGRNGYSSFMVPPSGAGSLHISNDLHRTQRWAFTQWLKDFGVRLEWVEVTFGREFGPAMVTDDCSRRELKAVS